MSWELTNTVAGRALKLAQRLKGMRSHDLPDKTPSDVSKVLRKLVEQGYLRLVDETLRPYTYKATKAQADAWVKANTKPPKPIVIKEPKKRAQPVVGQPKPRPTAKPASNAPMHFPTDENGRPLWKHTICPGFTGQPHKTNTHTGAY